MFGMVVLTCCNISGAIHGSTATACVGNWCAIWMLPALPWTGKNIHLFNPDKHTPPFEPIKIWLPFNALCQLKKKSNLLASKFYRILQSCKSGWHLTGTWPLNQLITCFYSSSMLLRKWSCLYLWIIPILWRYSRPCKISHRMAETSSSHMPSRKLFFNMSAQDPSESNKDRFNSERLILVNSLWIIIITIINKPLNWKTNKV